MFSPTLFLLKNSGADAILTLYFLVIKTVFYTNSSSAAQNFKDLNSFLTSSPWNSWKMSPIMRAFYKMPQKYRRAYCTSHKGMRTHLMIREEKKSVRI